MLKTENALNNWLVKPINEKENKNYRLCAELSNIEPLQQDMEMLADRLVKLRMAGIISGNDARRELGLDTIDDDNMDSVYISANQMDITEEIKESNGND